MQMNDHELLVRLRDLLEGAERHAGGAEREHARWVRRIAGRDRRLMVEAARAVDAVDDATSQLAESIRLIRRGRARTLVDQVVIAVGFWDEMLQPEAVGS
jgi:hypothetical protein